MERPVSSSAPTAFTPVGGYGDTSKGRYERELPVPILGDDEALADGVALGLGCLVVGADSDVGDSGGHG